MLDDVADVADVADVESTEDDVLALEFELVEASLVEVRPNCANAATMAATSGFVEDESSVDESAALCGGREWEEPVGHVSRPATLPVIADMDMRRLRVIGDVDRRMRDGHHGVVLTVLRLRDGENDGGGEGVALRSLFGGMWYR